MSKDKKNKKRFGDRKDAKLIRDVDELHIAMAHCFPKRTDNEAYISAQIELAPINNWIANHPDDEFKFTIFHIIVAACLKMLIVRPELNRFICNKRYYQKNDRTIGFIVKKEFADDSQEGMANLTGDENQTVFDIHNLIKEQVLPIKQGKNNDTQNGMEMFKKLPHWVNKLIFNVIRHWSEKGWLPHTITDGDVNHCSIFITNLGSIGLKCGYHHLMNYGTNSFFIVVGEKRLKPFFDEKGNVEMKEVIDIGLTIDERIADGYYYAKSLKIFKKVLENPELLELPLGTEVTL